MTNTTIKLSKLRLSPLNVRSVKPSAIDALAADIAAHGLLQNLLAYEEDGLFQVFAGGRRFRALQALKKRKAITGTHEVGVTLRTKEEAIELSLAENVQREDMHPADCVRAFTALRDEGKLSAAEIALRFGYSEGYVGKLLRLGCLAPALLDEFAEGQMSLETAQALVLVDDHGKQIEAFKRCGNSAYSIRRYLTQEKMTTRTAAFVYVGREAYEAAGGTITVDLFSEGDEGYADHPEIVEQLALAKLDEVESALQAEGWFQVLVSLSPPDNIYSLARLYPACRDVEEGEPRFTDEQKATGGVAAYLDYHGELKLTHYRAKAERREGSSGASETGPYSAALIEDLSRIRTQALQEAVSNDPALALDILLDSLTGQLLHGQYSSRMAANIRPERAATEVADELMVQSQIQPVEEAMATLFADIPTDGRFAAIRSMSQDDKLQLLAGMVALTLDGTLMRGCGRSERHEAFDTYAFAANLDLATSWTAPVAFFDRLKKSALLTILEQECGKEASTNCTKMKKGELAATVADRLPANWLPSPLILVEQPEDGGELSEAA